MSRDVVSEITERSSFFRKELFGTFLYNINMFYVYVMGSIKNKTLYIGFSENPKERLFLHNKGKNLSTKSGILLKNFFKDKKKIK